MLVILDKIEQTPYYLTYFSQLFNFVPLKTSEYQMFSDVFKAYKMENWSKMF